MVKDGKYDKEIIKYCEEISGYIDKKNQNYKNKIVIITNEAVLKVQNFQKLKKRVRLNDVHGLMFYFS